MEGSPCCRIRQCEAVFLLAWHKTFDKNALLASGNDVALVPLKELSIGEDGAGYGKI